MEGGEDLHNTSREELLRLLPDCRAPESVAKRLAEAGIMRVIKGKQEDDPVRYVGSGNRRFCQRSGSRIGRPLQRIVSVLSVA